MNGLRLLMIIALTGILIVPGGVFANHADTPTNGDDFLEGHAADKDKINALDGNDKVFGETNAEIEAGQGKADDLKGSGGDDELDGGPGNDILRGGADNDILFGDADNDLIDGGEGADQLFGGQNSGNPNDFELLDGGAGNDSLYGGGGRDNIKGGSGNDRLWGGPGDDELNGQGGDDNLYGGLGDDVLFAGDGTNFLFGDNGDDELVGFGIGTTLNGGPGFDICYTDGGDTLENCDDVQPLANAPSPATPGGGKGKSSNQPPDEVDDLTATATGDGQVTLNWSEPPNNGSPITGYLIESSLDGVTFGVLVADTSPDASTTFVDNAATNSVPNFYRVSAINDVDTADPSNIASATPGVPDAVDDLIATATGDGQVTLNWSEPPNNGITITGYLIESSLDGVTFGVLVADTSPDASTTFVDNAATNDVPNFYQVSAINGIDTAAASNIASATPGVPDAVDDLIATATGDVQVTLNWSEPPNNGITITGYLIESSLDGVTFGVLVADTSPDASTTFVDNAATNDVPNFYQVSAINSAGTAAASNIASATPTAALTTFIHVESIDITGQGGKDKNNNILFTVTVLDNTFSLPVAGAVVTMSITVDSVATPESPLTGITGADGTVKFKESQAADGLWDIDLGSLLVTHPDSMTEWDGNPPTQPVVPFPKNVP